MSLDPLLLDVLACPCPRHAEVEQVDDGLRCTVCEAVFPSATASRSCCSTRRPRAPVASWGHGPVVSLEDSLLDEPEELVRIDADRMLASTAGAGAAIRRPWIPNPQRFCPYPRDRAGPASQPVRGGRRGFECSGRGAGRGGWSGFPAAGVRDRRSHAAWLGGTDGPRRCGVGLWPTPEILTVATEAQRRGSSVLGLGAAGFPAARDVPAPGVCGSGRFRD